jgi:hypothetical protein
MVAHTCNPSYSGGRDQEERGSRSAQANSSQEPILKNPKQKKKDRAGGVAQGEGPEFKTLYYKKKIGGFGDQMYVHASQVFYPAPIDSYVMQ